MKYLILLFIGVFYLFVFIVPVFAINPPCTPNDTRVECKFGTINPPPALQNIIKSDPTGSGGISLFLNNLITLFYSIAGVVLIFMLIWGAFEWLTSGGDKEKISSAQKRIISAIIGVLLFAVAFAIIQVLGIFTGFTFYKGQNYTVTERDAQGGIKFFKCNNNSNRGAYQYDPNGPTKNPDLWCQNPPF